ncbi:MAG TPA: helix-turn-helix transcriptional regulator [Solirubrobacteraceae bacterium]|nr:helix-turn-helix transcriptional regulator [Solirubrobacteraceae bacterium]
MPERDFLDKVISKRAARYPEFPRLLDAARRRRELLRALAGQREEQKRSQTAIAAAMETSQSFVARLESTAADAKVSTVDRYAESLGFIVQYHLIPTAEADSAPPVVVHASQSACRDSSPPSGRWLIQGLVLGATSLRRHFLR